MFDNLQSCAAAYPNSNNEELAGFTNKDYGDDGLFFLSEDDKKHQRRIANSRRKLQVSIYGCISPTFGV